MARYTNFFTASASAHDLRQSVVQIFQACDLNLVYEAKDYLVAKEKPGQVAYSQLATVEVLINPVPPDQAGTCVNLVVKNEELPLKSNNHCQRVFELVNQVIARTQNWNSLQMG